MKKGKVKQFVGMLVLILALSTLLTACASGKQQEVVSQEETVQEEVEENEKVTEQESLVEDTQEPAIKTTTDVLQANKHGFDYTLYSALENQRNQVVLRFNYPYKADNFLLDGNYPSQYILSYDYGTLMITSEKYEVTEDNRLTYVNPNFVGMQDEVSLEDKGEVDTIYGKAETYFATEKGSDGSVLHREVARLNTDAGAVTIFWNDHGVEEWTGKIEDWLSILFTPIDVERDDVLVFDENNVTVDDSYDVYIRVNLVGETYKQINYNTRAFGFNKLGSIGGWSETLRIGSDDKFESYRLSNDDHENIMITNDVGLYNYFFGGRSLVDIEEKAEVETPFGTAKVYYAVRKDTEKPMEEEVAIINNNETNIVINYTNSKAQYDDAYAYDGVYDGKLEELIPELFK